MLRPTTRTTIRWTLLISLTGIISCSSDPETPNALDAGTADVAVTADVTPRSDAAASDSGPTDLGTAEDLGTADMGRDVGSTDAGLSQDVAPDLPPPPPLEVLVFSKTRGFRHPSIADAIPAIQQLGADNGFNVTLSEDSEIFVEPAIDEIDVVIFLMTSGEILNDTQQGAFEAWFQGGKGWFGIHSASDTEYAWPWYEGLVGAYFLDHPAQQDATVNVEASDHPATAHLPTEWTRRDEWYDFQTNPRPNVRVLMSLDETTYTGHVMEGDDHPIAWCQNYDGGRSIYTGGGHTSASYSDADFLQHLLGAIQWAGGRAAGDCSP